MNSGTTVTLAPVDKNGLAFERFFGLFCVRCVATYLRVNVRSYMFVAMRAAKRDECNALLETYVPMRVGQPTGAWCGGGDDLLHSLHPPFIHFFFFFLFN